MPGEGHMGSVGSSSVCVCVLSLLPFHLNVVAEVLSTQRHGATQVVLDSLRSLLTLIPLSVYEILPVLQVVLTFAWVMVHSSGTYVGPGANDESNCTYRKAPRYFSIPVLVFLYLACLCVALLPLWGIMAHESIRLKNPENCQTTLVFGPDNEGEKVENGLFQPNHESVANGTAGAKGFVEGAKDFINSSGYLLAILTAALVLYVLSVSVKCLMTIIVAFAEITIKPRH